MTDYVISDLHFGHKRILEFSPGLRGGTNSEEHDEWLISQINSRVTKQDRLYILGDIAMGKIHLPKVKRLNGFKYLVRGNHDTLSTHTYLEYFNQVYGILKLEGFWLTHAPIHPLELRGKKNIHGHVHQNSIPDDRYINACVEACNGIPLAIKDLR